MSAEHSIRELLEKGEFVWAPCVYDCLSARCAELVGHNAVLVSSCELEYAMNGIPAGMYNWEEYIYAAERICNSTKLPVIIDGENGGGTPMQVYRNVKRLAEVGAMAISIEDTNSGAFATGYTYASGYGYMDAERWAANVQAAVEATKGTDCMIIARTDCKGGGAPQTGAIAKFGGMGLEEAIRRAEMGYQAGAEITMIQNICHADCEDECREISRRLSKPGRYLFYPDVHATDGKPDATLEQMQEWGFHLVSNHVAMKGAARGMLEFFRENFKNKNTVYSENHEIDPSGELDIGHEFHLFKFEDYIALDKKYRAYEEELRAKNGK